MKLPRDRGAKFHKCDFQVHTPRDANWSGPFDPVTGRAAFADALVAECRRKGLQAIAITDHHDLCLQKEVKLAAAREKRIDGTPFPEGDRLIVFPGVELTLATPACQALLIFDSDIPEATLNLMWGALRLAPTPDTSEKTTLTQPLHTALDLSEISNALGGIRTNPEEMNPARFETLAGKFILLPNVREGGHKTIVRAGFHPHFVAMPCVGGYIEGRFYVDLDQSNREKIEGKQPQWGKRTLGVFQTSDCREVISNVVNGQQSFSFTNLGAWATWVKWSQPSAEAIRQACLARKSRISHSEPVYPLFQIVGVAVTNSSFLGPIELGLNPQFNAFIGGRGTGKSSLLEYIRWALCDDPLPFEDATELPNFQQRRKGLIEGTLRPAKAKVVVFYKRNEVVYRVERELTEKADTVTVYDPSNTPKAMNPAQVRTEFPVVSYAQKQLSSVGTLPVEINRLITAPVQEKVKEIQQRINTEIVPKLKQQRTREIRLAALNTAILEAETAIKGRKEQVQALQSQLNSLTSEQQNLIQSHDALARQEQWLTQALEMPNTLAILLRELRTQSDALGNAPASVGLPGAEKLATIAKEVDAFSKKVREVVATLIGETETKAWLSEEAQTIIDALRKSYAEHVVEYEKCIAANAKSQKQLEEIQSLNKLIGESETKLAATRSERSALQALLDEIGEAHWQSFLAALEERAALLREQCQLVNNQAQHEFRAELAFCGNKQPVSLATETLIQSKNVKDSESKVKGLAHLVARAAHPVQKWAEVMQELDALLASKGTDVTVAASNLKAAGFTDTNLGAIRAGLSQDALEQIRFLNIDDQIVFTFRLGKKPDGTENYIPFNAASPGQQATCLLRTLLAQSGAPLLIDQPEEDLDNEQIQVLSERIGETKHNRQLLFVSHNANIVVNGDAELVVCFGYRDTADNSRGKIAGAGSIDTKEIRERITAVMEGGREAFDLRKNKYGF